MIEDYLKNGSEFFIIRRWQEELKKGGALQMWQNIVANGLIKKYSKNAWSGLFYQSGKYYLTKEEGEDIVKSPFPIGYAHSISEQQSISSRAYPKVVNVLFDEAITNKIYLVDEFVEFEKMLSTIFRFREKARIFMCGNTINRYCPYFAEMGLTNIKKMKQGDIDIYSYGNSKLKMLVYYCESLASVQPNAYLFAFNNPSLNMITTGVWQLDLYPHLPVKYNDKEIRYKCFFEFETEKFEAHIVKKPNGQFLYIFPKTTEFMLKEKDIIFSLQPKYEKNYVANLLRTNHPVGSLIRNFFRDKKVFYSDNQTGDTIKNYLNSCKSTQLMI